MLRHRIVLAWFKLFVIAILFTVTANSMAQSAPAPIDSEAVKQLLGLIDQRLAVAPLVARAKWNSGGAIDDPAREQAILDNVSKQAEDAGLDASFARYFFQQQFDAGKMIQRDLHSQWQASHQGKFADAPDLAKDVRPVLDRLTPQLIMALRGLYPQLFQTPTNQLIQAQGAILIRNDLNGAVRDAALQPLLKARQ
jgi:chorismate mutase